MAQIKLDLPDSISEGEARLYFAMILYDREKVSLGKAVEIAGIPYEEFMKILGKHNIPIFRYSPEELENDVKTLDCYPQGNPKEE